MRAPISIVIPTFNDEAVLPACLSALMEGLEEGLIAELIVVDGGSTDATGALAQAWGAEVLVHQPPSRGAQLAKGCARAKGDWLLVVHADTVLAPGWAKAVRAHLAHPEQAAWFRLQFGNPTLAARLLAAWSNLRSLAGLPYGDQGLLISAALYARVGGYANVPHMEDVAMARALRGRLRGLSAVAVTTPDSFAPQGWVRRGFRNIWTLVRYLAGGDVNVLAAQYRR